ncbi:AraC family transcriptional regulator [Luteimonas sp. 9C]|uniref:helix-turn-helix domain-containing protein n=1 Tax=Luteimonas sp. 9C TaxID=2653148 RepID=UPI0012F28589|nr:AraC family transcriptional regulator [Luteimonas sp. 9C]
MSNWLWSARGQMLALEAIETAAKCVGVTRLGGMQVSAPVFNLWIQVRGDGWIESREGRFRMRRGDWMAFEKESTPLIQSGAQGLCIGIALDGHALDSLQSLNDGSLYAGRGRLPKRELRTLLRLWRAAAQGVGDALSVRPLLLQLAHVQRDLAATVRRCPGRSRSRKRQVFGRMQRARLYLEGNSDRVVRISELADLTSFSSWYFSKAFHALYDESPQALSVRLRLERAAQLLSTTSMMVGEVAAASGFDNCCSFARAFKNHHGIPASRYRSNLRQNAVSEANEAYATA